MFYRFFVIFISFIISAGVLASDLDWPTFRHDQERTGRSLAMGEITQPTVIWSEDFGGKLKGIRSWYGDIYGTPYFAFVEGGRLGLYAADNRMVWKTSSIGASEVMGLFDFNNDGQTEFLVGVNGPPASLALVDALTGNTIWYFSLPEPGARGMPSYQVLPVDLDNDNFIEILASATNEGDYTYAFDFRNGFLTDSSLNIRWKYHHNVYSRFIPYNAVDLNGDNIKDVICNEKFQIDIIDGMTGEEISITDDVYVSFQRGLLTTVDLAGDEGLALVSIASSEFALGVTVFDLETLSVKWQYQWFPSQGKAISFLHSSVADLDGDGISEIVLSIYNDIDDEYTTTDSTPADYDGINEPDIWSTIILDGVSGKILATLPERLLRAIEDVDSDGDKELFVLRVSQGEIETPKLGELELYTLNEGEWRLQTTLHNANAIFNYAPVEQTNNSNAWLMSPFFWDSDDDGVQELAIALDKSGDGLPDYFSLVNFQSGSAVEVGGFDHNNNSTALPIEYKGNDKNAPLAVALSNGTLGLYDKDLNLVGQHQIGGYTPSVLAANISGNDLLEIIVSDSDTNIKVMEKHINGQDTMFEPRWKRPLGSDLVSASTDTDDDGQTEIAVFNRLDATNPKVQLLNEDGLPIWEAIFTEYNSKVQQMTFGRLNNDDVEDLLVVIDNKTMTVTEDIRLVALNGIDGSEIWNVATDSNRSISPSILLNDLNDDGVEDIILEDAFYIEYYDGTSGSLLLTTPYWNWGTSAILANTDGDDQDELLLFSRPENQGILGYDLMAADPYMNISYSYLEEHFFLYSAIFGDTDYCNIISPNAQGQLKAHRGIDGMPYWDDGHIWIRDGEVFTTEQSGNNTISYVTVTDIDGDGEEDALVGTEDGYLQAIRISDKTLLWHIFLQEQVIEPIVADMDGDGKLEILATTTDGKVHLIDQKRLDPPMEVRDVKVFWEIPWDIQTDIDETKDRTHYGIAWRPVSGANRYRVSVVDESGLNIVPWHIVESTHTVIETAPRLYDKRYKAMVVALGEDHAVSVPAYSDGLVVVDHYAPVIRRMRILPRALNLGKNRITIRANLSDDTWLQDVTMRIMNKNGDVVFEKSQYISNTWYSISFTYSGEGIKNSGIHMAEIIATDGVGKSVSKVRYFQVVRPFKLKTSTPNNSRPF